LPASFLTLCSNAETKTGGGGLMEELGVNPTPRWRGENIDVEIDNLIKKPCVKLTFCSIHLNPPPPSK